VVKAYLQYEAPKLPSGAFTGATFKTEDKLLPLPQGQIDLVDQLFFNKILDSK
jgi:hypothetical protein